MPIRAAKSLPEDCQTLGIPWQQDTRATAGRDNAELLSWDAELKARIREEELVINKRRAQPRDTRPSTDRRAEPLFPGRKKQQSSPATATAGEAHLVQHFPSSNSLVQAIRRTQNKALLQRATAAKPLPAPGKLVSTLCSMGSHQAIVFLFI